MIFYKSYMLSPTHSIRLELITQFLHERLSLDEVQDYPHALNGLQVENSGEITRVATAVDASERVIREAFEKGVDLLLVHHGLFWQGLQPVTGAWKRKIQLALDHNLAIYSAHLPLDIHPLFGNNVLMAKACHIQITGSALRVRGKAMGIRGNYERTLGDLIEALTATLGKVPEVYSQVPLSESPGSIILCTGGAGNELSTVAQEHACTFITGEGSYWTIPMAQELGINLIYGGHYETETFGIRALGTLVSDIFGIPCNHLNVPPSSYTTYPQSL